MSDNRVSVLLDTNVFVAAYWAKFSASARLIKACTQGRIIAHYSTPVKREIIHILKQIKVSQAYMQELEAFWEVAVEVVPVPVESVKVADPDDQKFLEAAVGGQTDYLITSDDHLLEIGHISRTEILTPGSAVKVIEL